MCGYIILHSLLSAQMMPAVGILHVFFLRLLAALVLVSVMSDAEPWGVGGSSPELRDRGVRSYSRPRSRRPMRRSPSSRGGAYQGTQVRPPPTSWEIASGSQAERSGSSVRPSRAVSMPSRLWPPADEEQGGGQEPRGRMQRVRSPEQLQAKSPIARRKSPVALEESEGFVDQPPRVRRRLTGKTPSAPSDY